MLWSLRDSAGPRGQLCSHRTALLVSSLVLVLSLPGPLTSPRRSVNVYSVSFYIGIIQRLFSFHFLFFFFIFWSVYE